MPRNLLRNVSNTCFGVHTRDSFQIISISNQRWQQGGILFHGDEEANRIWRFDLEWK